METVNFNADAPHLPATSLTITAGIASLPEDAEEPLMLLDLADKALYYGKAQGRNRICTKVPAPPRAVGMRLGEFDYHLPAENIAQQPLPERDGSRLLLLPRAGGEVSETRLPRVARAAPAGRPAGGERHPGASAPGRRGRRQAEAGRS
ncbi:MAG: S-adenosylmethionine:tRNA ribosyltransferase-isomerase [Desulfosudis oleivorans]|nr:S-adenosylmethionine:tRNA ribosyltransferase-isomerase [Desulfosudis oleivorans]